MKETFKNIIIHILTWEAQMLLKRHKPKIVAITGSLGKTGTKDAVAAALSAKYSVRKSPKSFNSEFGLPLSVLGLQNAWSNPLKWLVIIVRGFCIAFFTKTYEEVLVLEIGADKPGDIKKVAQWLQADIVLITAVPETPVHVEFYPTAKDVLKEKAQLINALKKTRGVLITGTDEFVSTLYNEYGKTLRVDYDTAEIVYRDSLPIGMRFIIDGEVVNIIGVLGEHQGFAPAFAISVAKEFGVNIDDAIIAIESMSKTQGRMRLLDGKNGSVIIDDSYNSSPEALRAALVTLGRIEASGKKIALLGDMRELGKYSDAEHRRAGMQAAHIVDELYTVGPQARILAESAIEEGLQESNVHIFDTDKATEAGKELAGKLKQGDIILVKSSQGKLRLEKAVKEMMRDSSRANKLLVRQEKEWLTRR